MNHAGDATMTVAIYQLVMEAVVLTVGAHAWVCEIHLISEIHFVFLSLWVVSYS
jgi:hypothetical protein